MILSESERKQLARVMRPLNLRQKFSLAIWSIVSGLVFYAGLGIILGLICGVTWDILSSFARLK